MSGDARVLTCNFDQALTVICGAGAGMVVPGLRPLHLELSPEYRSAAARSNGNGNGSAPRPRRPRHRRRRPVAADPHHPDIRALYDDYIAIGWSLSRYAEERLGLKRQMVWYWFNNIYHPSPAIRAQIKARTGIEIGPRGSGIEDQLRRTRTSVARSQQTSATSRAQGEAAQRINNLHRTDNDEHRRTLDRLNRRGRS